MEVFVIEVFSQNRVLQRHPHFVALQPMCLTKRMSRVKRFFALFPGPKEMRGSPRTRVRECTGTLAHPVLIKWLLSRTPPIRGGHLGHGHI